MAGRTFGQRRLKSWLQTHAVPGKGATELRDRLSTELFRFRSDAVMVDDQAFLLLIEEDIGAKHPSPPAGRTVGKRHGGRPQLVTA
jgi:hypothetical protein